MFHWDGNTLPIFKPAKRTKLSHQFKGFIMYNAAINAVLFDTTLETLIWPDFFQASSFQLLKLENLLR